MPIGIFSFSPRPSPVLFYRRFLFVPYLSTGVGDHPQGTDHARGTALHRELARQAVVVAVSLFVISIPLPQPARYRARCTILLQENRSRRHEKAVFNCFRWPEICPRGWTISFTLLLTLSLTRFVTYRTSSFRSQIFTVSSTVDQSQLN